MFPGHLGQCDEGCRDAQTTEEAEAAEAQALAWFWIKGGGRIWICSLTKKKEEMATRFPDELGWIMIFHLPTIS